MINCDIISQVIYKIKNAKMLGTFKIYTAEFASNLTAIVCLMLAI